MIVDLSCQKCLELLSNATTLVPCGHTFCFKCVNDKNVVSCPKCKDEISGCYKNTPVINVLP